MAAGRTPFERVALFVATLAGAGYGPIAPGTWGTLAAVPLWLLVALSASPILYAGATVALIAIAIPCATTAERLLAKKDAGPVVIDEAAGFLVTMFLAPVTPISGVLGFVFFRIFDVLKFYPADRLERFPGGFGIVMDDVASGVYACLSLHLALWALRAAS
jgi:phosphatidylglycerophosphatase A